MKQTTKSNRAVLYCRVSTKEQVEDGNSLVTQEKNCREYAEKYGYEVVQVFIEQGESAKTADRTELRKLMSFCAVKKNDIGVVIAYKIDRISRNTDDYSQIRLLLRRYGVEIKSTSEHFENTPAGRFMENIIANVAQFDNDVRAERSIGGMRQALVEGRYVWMASLGYSNIKIDGKSTIAPNEKSEGVRIAFELIASGVLSVNETRLFVATLGVCQKNGKPLCKSHFYTLLRNKLYTGEMHKFGQIFKGNYEPIVSENVFNSVQAILKKKKISKVYRIENPDFPLRRFIFNSDRKSITGCWSQGRYKKYPYYRFNGETKFHKKESMEDKFIDFLNQFQLKEEHIQKFKDAVLEILKDGTGKPKELEIGLKDKIKLLQNKKKMLIEKSLNGVLPDNIFREELENITSELAVIEIKLAENPNTALNTELVFEELNNILINPGLFWKSKPFEIQRKLMWFDFPIGIEFDGENYRTTKICSIFKVKDVILKNNSGDVHHPVRKIKHSQLNDSPHLNKEELITLLKEVENEIHILNNHILKPTENTGVHSSLPILEEH